MSHSEISPSNAHRWMRCPGSVQLLRNVPPETESSESASLGTLKHALMAHFVMLCQSASSSVGVGGDWIVSATEYLKHHPLATDELRDGEFSRQLANYADYLIFNSVGSVRFGPTTLSLETPINLSPVSRGMRGTADAVIYRGINGTLEVVDYKSGSHSVSPRGNEQLMLYLIGALQMTSDGHCDCAGGNILTIAQPAADDSELQFRSCTIAIETVRDFLFSAQRQATIALWSENPPRKPSDVACQWCRATAICPDYHEWVSADVLVDAVDKSSDDVDLTDHLAKRVLDNRKAITALIKSCQEYATAKISIGDNFPGYQLVEKPGRRSVINNDAVKKKLRINLGFDALQPAGVGTLNRLARENDVDIDFAITRGDPKITLVPIEDSSGDFKTEEENENEN